MKRRYPLPFGWGPLGLVLLLICVVALQMIREFNKAHPEGFGAWLTVRVSEPDPALAPQEEHAPDRPLVMVMLGDSHVAADLLSGHVRTLLHGHFGEGFGLLLPVGQPHPGIRNALVAVQASAGWTYRTVMNAPADGRYGLSGTLAESSGPDQTLHWQVRNRVLPFSGVELTVQTGPQAGEIELALDGVSLGIFDLVRAEDGVLTIPLQPKTGGESAFRSLTLTTRSTRPVAVLQLRLVPSGTGLSLVSAGYPGATFPVFDRMETPGFDRTLQKLDPDFLVLAFGTNEGFDDHLALVRYQQAVGRQVQRFKTLLPQARLILITPPLGARANAGQDCGWQEPPKLPGVRQAQEQVAQSQSLALWNWSQIMPQSCAGHQWTLDQPRLMADDHIHLTGEGYRRSAEAFVTFVMPLIDQRMRERGNAVPKH